MDPRGESGFQQSQICKPTGQIEFQYLSDSMAGNELAEQASLGSLWPDNAEAVL